MKTDSGGGAALRRDHIFAEITGAGNSNYKYVYKLASPNSTNRLLIVYTFQ